jgi:hypothetical protein
MAVQTGGPTPKHYRIPDRPSPARPVRRPTVPPAEASRPDLSVRTVPYVLREFVSDRFPQYAVEAHVLTEKVTDHFRQ